MWCCKPAALRVCSLSTSDYHTGGLAAAGALQQCVCAREQLVQGLSNTHPCARTPAVPASTGAECRDMFPPGVRAAGADKVRHDSVTGQEEHTSAAAKLDAPGVNTADQVLARVEGEVALLCGCLRRCALIHCSTSAQSRRQVDGGKACAPGLDKATDRHTSGPNRLQTGRLTAGAPEAACVGISAHAGTAGVCHRWDAHWIVAGGIHRVTDNERTCWSGSQVCRSWTGGQPQA